MLKILGIITGMLLTVWAFDKFLTKEQQQDVLTMTNEAVQQVAQQAEEFSQSQEEQESEQEAQAAEVTTANTDIHADDHTLDSDVQAVAAESTEAIESTNNSVSPVSGDVIEQETQLEQEQLYFAVWPHFDSRSGALGFKKTLEAKANEQHLFDVVQDSKGNSHVVLTGISKSSILQQYEIVKLKVSILSSSDGQFIEL